MEEQLTSPAAIRSDLKPPQGAYHHSFTIPSSNSVEEGEIVESQIPFIQPLASLQWPKGQPPLLSSHASSRTVNPSSSTATIANRRTPSWAPAVETMTDEDLDRAKSLVLDLLGWGVTPEYLVECGVSPGAVYRIFTDLRLRLPSNLVPR